jgi:hypothetical protein
MSKTRYQEIVESYLATQKTRGNERSRSAEQRGRLCSRIQTELVAYLVVPGTSLVHVSPEEARLVISQKPSFIVAARLRMRDGDGEALRVDVEGTAEDLPAETHADIRAICVAIGAALLANTK